MTLEHQDEPENSTSMKRNRKPPGSLDFPACLCCVFLLSTFLVNLCIAEFSDFHDLESDSLITEQLRNVSAHVFYNHTIRKLQYLISWEDAPTSQRYNVIVALNSTNSDCSSHLPHLDSSVSRDTTELLVPKDEDEAFQLKGNCTYSIEVKAESLAQASVHSIYKPIWDTIPLCVDGVCDCQILRPEPVITAAHVVGTTFDVTWNFSSQGDINDIRRISFHVYNCSEETAIDAIEIEPLNLTNGTAQVDVATDLEEFCLLVTFLNKYNCTYVAREAIDKRYGDATNHSWLQVLSTVILVALLIILIAYWYVDKCRGVLKALIVARALRKRLNRQQFQTNIYGIYTGSRLTEANPLYVEQEIAEGITDDFELPRNHLTRLDRIGNGAFGEVFLGKALINGADHFVAIKTLRDKAPEDEMKDFLAEIEIMKEIGTHPNIVTMYKCCTLQQPYMMIMEYVPFGDLKHYLVDLRNQWYRRRNVAMSFNHNSDGSTSYISPESPITPCSATTMKSNATQYSNVTMTPTSVANFTFDVERVLDHRELQNFALQIAQGMAHLEKIPITHRDLAARNILVSESKVLKISDFGLSRVGPYINNRHKMLPLRWMALEAIEDHVYDNKTDVWSFAVVLWEIATLGAFPYGDVPDRMLLYNLQMGRRLNRPEICTDELYSIMLRCWSADPNLRPTFEELVTLLDVKKYSVYTDFAQLNPSYVFPPTGDENLPPILVHEREDEPKYLPVVAN